MLASGLLLAVLGFAALAGRDRRIEIACGALAVLVTAFGLTWLSVRSHDVDRATAALTARPEPVIVSGVAHLAREGGARYGEKRWLTMSAASTPGDVTRVLEGAGVDSFAFVDLPTDRPRVFPDFEPRSAEAVRLFEGVELRVTEWRKRQ
jgi:hypothetical protein